MNNHLSPEELEIWHAWKSMYAMAVSRIVQEISENTGLSEADFSVLSRLSDLGMGQLRQQELADSMKWSKSRLSHHLTRMQARGFIKRKPMESESGVLVIITEVGQSAIDDARPIHAAAVRRHLLNYFSPHDIQVFRGVAARLESESNR
jgi:DNA-binding MarR family transcriptional regulator